MNGTCQYDDSLFYLEVQPIPQSFASATNYLWEFWFYIPNTTQSNTVQAMEFDLFQAVPLSDGMHEFMFGSQCNYAKNAVGLLAAERLPSDLGEFQCSPCRFSTGTWHHAVYFLQRVTSAGYQQIPLTFSPIDRHQQLPAIWNADDRRPDHISWGTGMVDCSEASVGTGCGRATPVGYVGRRQF